MFRSFFMQMEVNLQMKIEDIVDVISMYTNTLKPHFAIALARAIANDEEYFNLYLSSEDYDDFERKVLSKECALNEIYAQISRYGTRADSHWCRIMDLFGESSFKVHSERGKVLIGTEELKTFVNSRGSSLNGFYDVSHVAVFNIGDKDYKVVYGCIDKMMDKKDFLIIGEFNIYDYDGGSADLNFIEPFRKIKDGWYRIYAYDGFVAFVEF